MDGKLARGYAREGRRDDERFDKKLAAAIQVFEQIAEEEVQHKGRISTRRVAEVFAHNAILRKNTVFVRTAELRRGWGSSAKVEIAGTFAPQITTYSGRLERVSRYSVEAAFITKKSFDKRIETKPFFLREHAAKRFIERSNARYEDAFLSLWPAVLVPMLIQQSATLIDQQIALPVEQGLFLGDYQWCSDNEFAVVSRTGHSAGRRLDECRVADLYTPAVWLNTFVSFSEMSDAQATLWLQLTKFLSANEDELLEWHALAPLTFAGTNQPLHLLCQQRECGRAGELKNSFLKIYASKLWRDILRRKTPGLATTAKPSGGPCSVKLPQNNWNLTIPKRWQKNSSV